jgi:hypothetical protein
MKFITSLAFLSALVLAAPADYYKPYEKKVEYEKIVEKYDYDYKPYEKKVYKKKEYDYKPYEKKVDYYKKKYE